MMYWQQTPGLKARSHCAFFSDCDCDSSNGLYRNQWKYVCDCDNIPSSYVTHCKQKSNRSRNQKKSHCVNKPLNNVHIWRIQLVMGERGYQNHSAALMKLPHCDTRGINLFKHQTPHTAPLVSNKFDQLKKKFYFILGKLHCDLRDSNGFRTQDLYHLWLPVKWNEDGAPDPNDYVPYLCCWPLGAPDPNGYLPYLCCWLCSWSKWLCTVFVLVCKSPAPCRSFTTARSI